MIDADQMYAAAFAVAERLAELRAARRQRLRDDRNARRRDRYAVRKAAGILPAPKPAPVAYDDDDLCVEPGCRCQVVAMAPCSWCEDGGTYDDDGNPITPGSDNPITAAV